MKSAKYIGSCVSGIPLRLLEKIIDYSKEITHKTFINNVSASEFKDIKENLGYSNKFPLKNDWHVKYRKTIYKGYVYYMIVHSATEYIFRRKMEINYDKM